MMARRHRVHPLVHELRARRLVLGNPQGAVARLAGLTPHQLRDRETGASKTTLAEADAIARALGMRLVLITTTDLEGLQ
ncbi:helix-turn-helix domain-containing protein [Nonomuraea sp. NPDC050328]|uniref:helix-turn-helix domain-containing protein n=1 Tax=Nonomuraea sp. NPDC050328 TaxID=3364361 RepID=UPI0037A3E916